MRTPKKGLLTRLFGTAMAPYNYIAKSSYKYTGYKFPEVPDDAAKKVYNATIGKHISYDIAKRGWNNDSPMYEYPKARALKNVFKHHCQKKELAWKFISPLLWSDLVVDVAKVFVPNKDSALLPRFQHSSVDDDLNKFKLDPKLKARLQASTSLETSRGFWRSFRTVMGMYWAKAGMKELGIAATLAALTLYTSKESVDVLGDFSNWGRDFYDFYVNSGGTSEAFKTGLLDALKGAYDLNAYASTIDLIQNIIQNSTYDLSSFDIASSLAKVRIDPAVISQVTDQIAARFGDLSLEHFSAGQNAEALKAIVANVDLPEEQQTEIINAVMNGVDIQAASADVIEKVREQFGSVNFDTINITGNEEQAKNLLADMDYLLAENVLQSTGVEKNVSHLLTTVPKEFSMLLGKFLLYILPSIYTAAHLALRWQTWMTGKISNEWLKYKAAYKVKFSHTGIDNPDQRIQENLSNITDFVVETTTDGMQNALKLIKFLPMLAAMGSFNPAFLGGPDVTINNYLTWSALAYATVATGALGAIVHNLPRLQRASQRVRAHFRAALISVHAQPEQIMLAKGEAREKAILEDKFDDVIDIDKRLINKKMQITTMNSIFGNVGSYVPFILAAPQYFAGIITFGQVSQAMGIFRTVEGCFEFAKNILVPYSNFKAGLDRTAQLVDGLSLVRYEELERRYYMEQEAKQNGGAPTPTPAPSV